jgi:hypothetical protein
VDSVVVVLKWNLLYKICWQSYGAPAVICTCNFKTGMPPIGDLRWTKHAKWICPNIVAWLNYHNQFCPCHACGYSDIFHLTPMLLFFTEVRGECRKQFCLSWLPRAVDFKVSCSQIPRRALAGIRTHDPLVGSSTS